MPDKPHSPRSALREFLKSEAGGGVLLIAAAALAMLVANLPGLSESYFHLLHWTTGPVLSPKYGPMTVHLWINDGLMAIFFLLVGLEIKREFVDGRLATWQHRRLPVVAAAAGMVVPALVYLAVTGGRPDLQGGWAVPAATDIAFAIGVLALLGSRAPASLKLFLTTVAIVDDMGAVAIIALAYTDGIASLALAGAGMVLAAMYVLNQSKVRSLTPYLLLGLALWYFVFLSGVHATIAGVATALMIPVKPTPAAPDAVDSPLHRLEHALQPWVAYAIVPLFGFANAGVSLAGISAGVLLDPLPLGVALGLLLGKQIGIFGSVWIADRTGFAPRPGGASWVQIWGLSLMAGIGFTMSLFIGGLAFPNDPLLVDEVKIGVLAGSLLSALAGYAVLRLAPRRLPRRAGPNRPSM
ncbi:Na+/H+ antiporter NhaA [Sphingomonas desiccabilis]|uniref:Na(+)/H(+) antiporter NhaA n=2 Tax=Sphingomonas desiccabilis TaxID=429134 RepID=A0A4Q2IR37_9SPHN|nr:Na+/H+ antiporter NhaA [Sphingomonas desiccabilis]MBB3912143.1 NhaA family Na+:H+ antiporter [Sphingomonas desiccabilis]RXZ30306.1 Na+/H+ antiporter NhaA [Sphingomonas desiccabilis]